MTNFNKAVKNGKRGLNKKDGQRAANTTRDYTPANRWTQCWGEGLPCFEVGPSVRLTDNGLAAVLVARCERAGIELIFPATADFAEIRAQVDDQILQIIRYDAAEAEEIDWAEWETAGLAYDFDHWMSVMDSPEVGA